MFLGIDYLLNGFLRKNGQTLVRAISPVQQALEAGTHVLTLDFDGSKLRRSGMNGPYTLSLKFRETNTFNGVDEAFDTQTYDYNDFELPLLTPTGNFNDQGVDTNNNGLFDLLRIDFEADIQTAGSYLVSGELTNLAENFIAFTDDVELTLAAGSQMLTFDFIGPLIHDQGINGPYSVEVVIRDPSTFDELDRGSLGLQTAAYSYTDFDSLISR